MWQLGMNKITRIGHEKEHHFPWENEHCSSNSFDVKYLKNNKL